MRRKELNDTQKQLNCEVKKFLFLFIQEEWEKETTEKRNTKEKGVTFRLAQAINFNTINIY